MISFFKGALLKDAKNILTQPGPNTQAVRTIRFTNVKEIIEKEPILKSYIKEAIKVEKAGLKAKFKKFTEHSIPDELQNKMNKNPVFKTAFNALTPGRQREYILHFSSPMQSKTRVSRIEKCIPQILNGKGLNDDYRSKRK